MATIKREVPPMNEVKMVTVNQLMELQNDIRKCRELLDITVNYASLGAMAYTGSVVLITEVTEKLKKADNTLNEWER